MIVIKKHQRKMFILLSFAGIVILGYLLCCVHFCIFPGRINVDKISPSERRGEAAVLLLSPGELNEYVYKDVLYRLNIKRKVSTDGVRWWNLPVKALQIKRNIKKTIKGDCVEAGENLYNKLGSKIGDRFALYRANLFGPPFIETSVGDILRDGYDRIVVLNNSLVEQPYKEVIDSKILKTIDKSGVKAEVIFSFPLWNHDGLISYYGQSIMEKARETDPERVGVILIGKENNKKVRKMYPETVKQEAVFYNKIKENLMKNGYESRKIKVAYLCCRRMDIRDVANHLVECDIDKLIVAAAGFEGLNLDIERVLHRVFGRLNLPECVDMEFIGPWGDNDYLIEALMKRLEMVDA